MDKETYESLLVAAQYLMESEETHYEENERPAGHIYEHALRVWKWAEVNRPTGA